MDLCNVKEIKLLLERHGFKFSKAMGQNFLISGWVPERIVEESGVDKSSGVLEIGPGIGCLTKQLSVAAGKVVAVELDRRLAPLLEESLSDCENVNIIWNNILKMDVHIIVKDNFTGYKPSVCANLPYNITSPVLSILIDSKCFDSITVMVQREVARRICSMPGTADYGAFTVYVNFYTEPEILFDVAPSCFLPQPKVHSSVIKLKTRAAPIAGINNEALFFKVVRASFAQRRKTLVNGLFSIFNNILSKEELADIIVSLGWDARIRGEELDIAGFAKISNALGEVQR